MINAALLVSHRPLAKIPNQGLGTVSFLFKTVSCIPVIFICTSDRDILLLAIKDLDNLVCAAVDLPNQNGAPGRSFFNHLQDIFTLVLDGEERIYQNQKDCEGTKQVP